MVSLFVQPMLLLKLLLERTVYFCVAGNDLKFLYEAYLKENCLDAIVSGKFWPVVFSEPLGNFLTNLRLRIMNVHNVLLFSVFSCRSVELDDIGLTCSMLCLEKIPVGTLLQSSHNEINPASNLRKNLRVLTIFFRFHESFPYEFHSV